MRSAFVAQLGGALPRCASGRTDLPRHRVGLLQTLDEEKKADKLLTTTCDKAYQQERICRRRSRHCLTPARAPFLCLSDDNWHGTS